MTGNAAKKKWTVPDTYVIVFMIMLLAAFMTFVVPAGKYDVIAGTKNIDPTSYHTVEQTPISLMGSLSSVPQGMKRCMNISIFTMFIWGYFGVISDTGSIDRTMGRMVKKAGSK